MPVTIRQVGPCFAGEVDGIDMRQPLPAAGRRRHPRRHGQVRRAGLPRPAHRRRAAARLHPQPRRDRARHRHQPARAERVPPADHVRRRLQPRQGQQAVRARRPAAAVRASATGCGTPTARSRRRPAKYSLLHARIDPVEGRQHRVRRHARRLRCARRRDQGADARTWSASTRRSISRQQLGFTDFTDEERERFKPVRQRAGAHASGDGPQVALSVLARRRHRRLAGAGGARASCAT